ncbi:hypothetical protein NE237_001633 [Protea cynaroides]|uniref:Uncharacterized protein n=1 Tax=Protea cynaroides TaxID=273540 RepID=A0A9Q0QYK0_9MAGN|nr:hypothetical protein NE237_001633 [Protea cynaroides]
MELQFSDNILRYSNPSFTSSPLAFNFRSSPIKNPIFFHSKSRKWCWTSKIPSCSSVSSASCASNTKSYGGWEDLKPIEDSNRSGKLGQFQSFLISVGIDDRKHLIMFLLGFVSALAVSRVKVSTILVFPASVLVFAAGFALGFVRVGDIDTSLKDVRLKGSKRTSKEENFDISADRLKKLVDFFRELDTKLTNLTNEMDATIDSNCIQLSDLESYVEVINSISLSALPAKNVVETSINSMGFSGSGDSSSVLVEDREVEKNSNQKPSRKRKELFATGFDIFHFLGGFFQEYSVGRKHNKVKDLAKTKHSEPLYSKESKDQLRGSVFAPEVKEKKVINPVLSYKSEYVNANSSPTLDQDGSEKLGDVIKKLELNPGKAKPNFLETDLKFKRVFNSEEFSYPNDSQFMNNHGILLKLGHQNENRSWLPHDNLPYDQEDLRVNSRYRKTGVNSFSMEADESFPPGQTLNKSNGAHIPHLNGDRNVNGTCRSHFREERMKSDDQLPLPSADNMEVASTSSSSMISEDVAFDRYLTEAADLLKKSRECLRVKGDAERAEVMLYKSARLLSQAIAMKPMSLLAVGQLGNTYLLHGELKLKISRDLRTMLSRKDSPFVEKQGKVRKGLDDQVVRKDRMASMLVDECEECEELLIEAGRKYRLALSIDGNDVRALYNWGLALSFRAQLISDIGPEAAFDADKLYLAAIDKFDAMMSKSNAYAPDALFRWGIALQHRSRMRPSNNKEKIKLLQQARRLFEDALHMDSDNNQLREALASCLLTTKIIYLQPPNLFQPSDKVMAQELPPEGCMLGLWIEDFSLGTSPRSTNLLHGGVRNLKGCVQSICKILHTFTMTIFYEDHVLVSSNGQDQCCEIDSLVNNLFVSPPQNLNYCILFW